MIIIEHILSNSVEQNNRTYFNFIDLFVFYISWFNEIAKYRICACENISRGTEFKTNFTVRWKY